MPTAQPLRTGDPQRLGEYALSGRLGEGGQGAVFLGSRSGETYAVKLLHGPVGDERAAFLREVELAKHVARFCTAQVIDAGFDEGRPYIVSEYIDGPSLQREVMLTGPRHGGALERLAVSTATALTAIHWAGIVHRDFKPQNVLLGSDGPRVIDFGLAKALDAAATVSGRGVGTPAYMAPEQITASAVTGAADVFSWGATMCFAANASAPFGQDSVAPVLHRILTAPPELGRLDGQLRTLVEACLDKDSRNRPTSRDLLFELLGDSSGGVPADVLRSPPPHILRAPPLIPEPRSPAPDPSDAPAPSPAPMAEPEETGALGGYHLPDPTAEPPPPANPTNGAHPPPSDSPPDDSLTRHPAHPPPLAQPQPPTSHPGPISSHTPTPSSRPASSAQPTPSSDPPLAAYSPIPAESLGGAPGTGEGGASGTGEGGASGTGEGGASGTGEGGASGTGRGGASGTGDDSGPSASGKVSYRGWPRAAIAVCVALLVTAGVLLIVLIPSLTRNARQQSTVDVQAGGPLAPPTSQPPSSHKPSPTRTETTQQTRGPRDSGAINDPPVAHPPTAAIPPLTGLTKSAATKALKQAGLTLGPVSQVDAPQKPGQVLSSHPAPGTFVNKGSKVSLRVSAGLAVPAVTGMQRKAAESALTNAGLKPGAISRSCSQRPNNQVLSSQPQAGRRVPGSTPVALMLSRHGSTVPPVVGQPTDSARATLTAAGFTVGTTDQVVADESQIGMVLSQSVRSGSCTKPGTQILLTIGQAPPTTPDPHEPTEPPTTPSTPDPQP
ncbi:PASTA domain-containing protein [Nonomuraea sp. NPDC050404]|uniref:serine/threonine-protein kinase n=1 Tax=Nonomuraea sp. NPDC050404 TaxID=3155783 RepID=UPI0033DE7B32